MTSGRKGLVHVFSALSSVLALILLSLSFVPYPSLKALADRLVADGELESFSPHLAQVLRIPWGVAGGVLLFAAAWSILYPNACSRLLSLCLRRAADWLRDLEQFVADLRLLRLSRVEIASVAAICGLGMIARLMLINLSVEYDEAYTVMAFAHSPFRILVSDYHVPNNHVFHTILVRIAVLLLGSQPWQIRMPVLLAGMLLIPFVFWLGRTLYTRDVGLLSAAIVAFLPNMVQRSVIARGYIIVTLFTVMAFLLAYYLARHRNLFAWSLLVILCALGFYTVPIMLFPFGFLILWMLMSTPDLDKDQYTRSAWGLHLAVAGIMVVLLTLFLYSPILLSTGLEYIFPSSGVLHSQTLQALLDGLPGLTSGVIAEWTERLGPVWRGIFLLGMLLSVLSICDRRNRRVHTALAFLPAVFVLLLIQRPNPLGRIWLWVIPFAAIWVSVGLGILFQLIRRNRVGQGLGAVLLVSVIVGLAATGIQSSRQRVIDNDVDFPAAEELARFLAPRLTSKSLLVVDYAWDAWIWYYLYLQGVDRPLIFHPHKNRPFDEVFAIVSTGASSCHDGDVLETLEDHGPDLSLLNLDQMSEVAQIDSMKICWIPILHQ
jgi:4-amino-4-deoxy-L-arabinose transferase-like glycosyltransferase